MKECQYRLKRIIKEFEVCHDALVAIGDETRQLINMRREGTKNYYYMDANETQWGQIAQLVNHIYEVVKDFAPIDTRKGDD